MVHAGCIFFAITGLLAPQMGHALKLSENSQHTSSEILAAFAEKPFLEQFGDDLYHSLVPIFQDGPYHKAWPQPDQMILNSFSRGTSAAVAFADGFLNESDRLVRDAQNASWPSFAGKLYHKVLSLNVERNNNGGKLIDFICNTFRVITTTELRDGCRHLTSSAASLQSAVVLAREVVIADPSNSTANISGKLTQLNATLHDVALESRLGSPKFITGLPELTVVLDGVAHTIAWHCSGKASEICIPDFLDQVARAITTSGETDAFQIDRMAQSLASSVDMALQVYNFKSKSNGELHAQEVGAMPDATTMPE